MAFKEVAIESLEFNPFTKISKEWMLVTAGDEKKSNTMTASWGGVGIMWGKNIATAYIRPQRYTKQFIDEQKEFSVCVLPEEYRKALTYCGRTSGKDVADKFAGAGITLDFCGDVPVIKEAGITLICRKMCEGDIDPATFADPEEGAKVYPDKDYHRYYIAEIEKVLVPDEY